MDNLSRHIEACLKYQHSANARASYTLHRCVLTIFKDKLPNLHVLFLEKFEYIYKLFETSNFNFYFQSIQMLQCTLLRQLCDRIILNHKNIISGQYSWQSITNQ